MDASCSCLKLQQSDVPDRSNRIVAIKDGCEDQNPSRQPSPSLVARPPRRRSCLGPAIVSSNPVFQESVDPIFPERCLITTLRSPRSAQTARTRSPAGNSERPPRGFPHQRWLEQSTTADERPSLGFPRPMPPGEPSLFRCITWRTWGTPTSSHLRHFASLLVRGHLAFKTLCLKC